MDPKKITKIEFLGNYMGLLNVLYIIPLSVPICFLEATSDPLNFTQDKYKRDNGDLNKLMTPKILSIESFMEFLYNIFVIFKIIAKCSNLFYSLTYLSFHSYFKNVNLKWFEASPT